MSLAKQLIEELERDEDSRRKLARMLALDIASEESLRTLLLEALLRDIVTKKDLKDVEDRLRREIENLREDVKVLHQRFDTMLKWVIGLLASVWLTLVALLLPIVLKLAGVLG